MIPPTLVLLDIDGTLITAPGTGSRALTAAGRAVFGHGFELPDMDTSGKLDPMITRELAGLLPQFDLLTHEERFREAYFAALERDRARMRLLPGVAEVVSALRDAPHVTLGLLTGNHGRAVAIKLAAVGLELDPFEVNAFGDEADTRPELVALAMERYRDRHGRPVPAERVIVVGDTPRDVECARLNGCVAFAVATGRWSLEALREAEPDHAVADLSDPTPLLGLVGLA